METIKKINTTETITITETNYSDNNKNGGLLLGKTLKPIHSIFCNNERTNIVWQDVNSKDKFMTKCYSGKITIKNEEFVLVTIWRGFDNKQKTSYTAKDWRKKEIVICKNYKVNK